MVVPFLFTSIVKVFPLLGATSTSSSTVSIVHLEAGIVAGIVNSSLPVPAIISAVAKDKTERTQTSVPKDILEEEIAAPALTFAFSILY